MRYAGIARRADRDDGIENGLLGVQGEGERMDFDSEGLVACRIVVNALEAFVLAVAFGQVFPEAGSTAYFRA
jgi:hypothetical protein